MSIKNPVITLKTSYSTNDIDEVLSTDYFDTIKKLAIVYFFLGIAAFILMLIFLYSYLSIKIILIFLSVVFIGYFFSVAYLRVFFIYNEEYSKKNSSYPGYNTHMMFKKYSIMFEKNDICVTTGFANKFIATINVHMNYQNILDITKFFEAKPKTLFHPLRPKYNENTVALVPPIFNRTLYLISLRTPIEVNKKKYAMVLLDIEDINKFKEILKRKTQALKV